MNMHVYVRVLGAASSHELCIYFMQLPILYNILEQCSNTKRNAMVFQSLKFIYFFKFTMLEKRFTVLRYTMGLLWYRVCISLKTTTILGMLCMVLSSFDLKI